MELDFIKLSPLGNTTVFLRGEAAQEARAALPSEAMDYDHLAAEQAASAEEIAAASHTLSELAQQLKQGVAKFRL